MFSLALLAPLASSDPLRISRALPHRGTQAMLDRDAETGAGSRAVAASVTPAASSPGRALFGADSSISGLFETVSVDETGRRSHAKPEKLDRKDRGARGHAIRVLHLFRDTRGRSIWPLGGVPLGRERIFKALQGEIGAFEHEIRRF